MKKVLIPLVIIILIISGFYFYRLYKLKHFINSIDEFVNTNDFYIYGNHLNIIGDKKENTKLVLKSVDDEIEYDIKFQDNIFYISDKINEGINLEKIKNGKYYILLKENKKYYGIKNNTKNKVTKYYTLNNKKVKVAFDDLMYMNVTNTNHKSYDIVIDAGHGGIDSGAINDNNYESYYTLKYATALKDKLEQLGYKVKLTRSDNDGINTYGKNSRTSIGYEVNAKYVFSIHFNSSESYIVQSGVEIYCPNNANLDFASDIVKNIVDKTSIDYSTNTAFKVKKGVYVRTFRDSEISYMNEQANKNNYEPYNITNETPYLYMIRETGGSITHAFVDGRNENNDKNIYHDSNIGLESYLLELGYINNSKDLNIIKTEKNKYINAIAESIDKHIKNNT